MECGGTRGIPLGAGGLIRAYARCGAIALEASGIGIMREMTICNIFVPYSLYEQVKRLLLFNNVEDIKEDFTEKVEINFLILSDSFPKLQDELTELTYGAIPVNVKGIKLARCKV